MSLPDIAPVWTREELLTLREVLSELLVNKFGIKKERMSDLIDERSIRMFAISLTHKSVSHKRKQNYDIFEFIGDTIVNDIIARHVSRRFPDLNVKWITEIKHNLQSARYLAEISAKLGIDKFVKFNREYEEFVRDPDKIRKMYSDLVESLCGFIRTLLFERGFGDAGGVAVCDNMLMAYLKEKHISLRYEDVFDPVTIFKETCDRMARYLPTGEPAPKGTIGTPQWTFKKGNTYREFDRRVLLNGEERTEYTFEYYGWFGRYELLSRQTGFFKDDVKKQGALGALEQLRKRGIIPNTESPYEREF